MAIAVKVTPPSRLRSMANTAPAPRLWVQVMACTSPAFQLTLVFGAVTVTLGATSENRPVMALAPPWFQVRRMRAAAVAGPPGVQGKLPVLGAAATRVW